MNIRLCFSALVAILLGACTDQAAGQKGHTVALKTNVDSVSYGIGTDIGHNMKMGGLDSLNVQAIAMGIGDGIDSTEKITSDKVKSIVQAYMLEAQKKVMARQAAEGEALMRKGEEWLMANGKKPGVQTTNSGLQYEVITPGNGPKPTVNDQVTVQYRGTLVDGKQFDSSYDRGEPAVFAVVGQVPPGWSEGLQLMSVGGKYKLYIPQNLAWGAQGAGKEIPPYSPVIIEMELLSIAPMAAPPAEQK
jgi:FKBP-type peptidyl-prolyl cis-trans isomerase